MASDSESDRDSKSKKHKKEKKEKKEKKSSKDKDKDKDKDSRSSSAKEPVEEEVPRVSDAAETMQDKPIILPIVTVADVIPKKDTSAASAPSDRDRDRDRDRERDRDRDRDRDRRASRSNSRRRRDRRDRSRSYDRVRRRNRSRTPPRRRSRSRDRSRRDSRDRDRDRRDRSRSRNKDDGKSENLVKPITLKDVLKAFPGISIPEAVQRMNAHNIAAAAANGGDAVISTLPTLGNVPNPLLGGGVVAEGGMATKVHRELYIGNLPPGVTVTQMTDFMNAAMKQMGLSRDGKNCVCSSWVSTDGHYAFVEVRSIEEANLALANLNGILIGANQLKVGRPKGYVGGATPGSAPPAPGLSHPQIGSADSADASSNVVMVTNLSSLINESQARELVSTFGALKAFNLIKSQNGQTQSAVFEYEDAAVADGAMQALNKLEVANFHLSVQRVPKSTAALLLVPSSNGESSKDKDPLSDLPPTKVLRMLNMVSEVDLSDDETFTELKEDVEEECGNYGAVQSIAIPRVGTLGEGGVGLIFVHFLTEEAAARAKAAISGRSFGGKMVSCTFFPEDRYATKEFGFQG